MRKNGMKEKSMEEGTEGSVAEQKFWKHIEY